MASTRGIVTTAGVTLGILALLGLGVDTIITAPPYAAVYVSDTRREFITPPFLAEHPSYAVDYARPWTYGAARAAGYGSERKCNNESCWSQEGRSLTGNAIQAAGVLPPLRSRWNPDGTWNW